MSDKIDLSGITILMVDDEPDNLIPLGKLLKSMGVKVELAANGLIGLEMLMQNLPDVILLDLSMPVMDGWSMLRELRANSRTAAIPVLAVTAHALESDRERVRAAGFDGFIAKPFRPTAVIQQINESVKSNTIALRS